MNGLQRFAVGCVVLVAVVLLASWEFIVAGCVAVVVLAVVALGFVLRLRKEVFYLRTTVYKVNADDDFFVEHDLIAVRVEVARLWLLFLPTVLGIAFLLVTSAAGTTWRFSLFEQMERFSPYFYLIRLPLFAVFGIIWTWVSERWVLHRADQACSARGLSGQAGRIAYNFVDHAGEYYGGEALAFGLARSAELSSMVLYCSGNPELSKIGAGLLFHRLTIVGRGLTDMDQETAAAYQVVPQTSI